MGKLIANIICGFIPSKKWRYKVRNIVIGFGIAFDHFRAIRKEPKLKFKHYLSVCAIAKNEGCYFREWIEFHRLVGVEKFYIYDNESSDDTKKILEPYIESGLVEYIFWPGERQQEPVYDDCAAKHKCDTKWLAIIDLDEFIVPIETKTIPEFLRKLSPKVTQLMIGWFVYGSSGREKKPGGLVMENFRRRGKDDASPYPKSIVNPRMAYKFNCHVHSVSGRTIDENGTVFFSYEERRGLLFFPPWPESPIPKNKIRVNHYLCKSWEEYRLRRARGDAWHGVRAGERYTRSLFDACDKNDILDPIMDKYVGPVKKALKSL